MLVLISIGFLLSQNAYAELLSYELRRALVYECNQECFWVDSRDPISRYSNGVLNIDLNENNQPVWIGYYVETEFQENLYIYTLAQRIISGSVLNLELENGWRILFMYWSPDQRMSFFVDDQTGQTMYLNFWPAERFE
jgi:hypothetical protein